MIGNGDIVVEKPIVDDREYCAYVIENGIRVLLISDPETDMGAASLNVNVGAALDPQEYPGIAHFCEHLLFMGSEKFPNRNDFFKFIEEHGGSSNAETSLENTAYYFEVGADYLESALDIFSQFFISPSFDKTGVDTEANVVQQEHEKNLASDSCRMDYFLRSACDPKHPISKFDAGSVYTLKTLPSMNNVSARDLVMKFYNDYYSSNLMNLIIYGKESISQLKYYVTNFFSTVRNLNLAPPVFDNDPFGNYCKQKLYYVVPVKSVNKLFISWVIPELRDFYIGYPEAYFIELMEQEQNGGFVFTAIEKGWLSDLECYISCQVRGCAVMNVVMRLTDHGQDHVFDVLELFHQYLNLIKTSKSFEWLFDELRKRKLMMFNYRDKSQPIDYVVDINENMPHRHLNDCLSGGILLKQYMPDLIRAVLEHIDPENCCIAMMSERYDKIADSTERWYGIRYKEETIPEELISKWKNCTPSSIFTFPVKNEFIATDFHIIDGPVTRFPEVIKESDFTRLWYKRDDEFKLPNCYIMHKFQSPFLNASPLHACVGYVFARLLKLDLREHIYLGTKAGISADFSFEHDHFELEVRGFNDKIREFINIIVKSIFTREVHPEAFFYVRKLLEDALVNAYKISPVSQAEEELQCLVIVGRWRNKQLLEALKNLDFDAFMECTKLIFQRMFVESFIYGNVHQEAALAIVNGVESCLLHNHVQSVPVNEFHSNKEVQVPVGTNILYKQLNEASSVNAVMVFFQCFHYDLPDYVVALLFAQIIQEPFFDILRTREQLGYLVDSGTEKLLETLNILLSIQTSCRPEFVNGRINAFLSFFKDYIKNMTTEEFETNKQSLIVKTLDKPKSIHEQAHIWWNEINYGHNVFDRDERVAKILRSLTIADVSNFYENYICHDGWKQRRITVYITPDEKTKTCQANAELTNNSILMDALNEEGNEFILYPTPQLPEPTEILDGQSWKDAVSILTPDDAEAVAF